MTAENLQKLIKYYRTSITFLFITSFVVTVLLTMRLFGNYGLFSLNVAVVHLGVMGALSFALMGLFLRIFYQFEQLEISDWVVDTIHALLYGGMVILFIGFVMQSWVVLTIGFLGSAYALLWWTFQYFRWYFRISADQRKGVLLFGAFAALGLVAAVLLGGYLMHGYLENNTPQNIRLAHIHAGLVGWGTLGLLGIGVALRGQQRAVTESIGALQGSAWIWFTGLILLVSMMLSWEISVIMIAGGLAFLGFLGYGYSMPKVGKLGDDEEKSSDVPSIGKKLLPLIIVGFVSLLFTILVAFDISINYPSGRAGIHRIFGVGGWLLMTYLMAMLSDLPKAVLQRRKIIGGQPGLHNDKEFLFPPIFR
ncbi:MAG: hypothetical protein GF372_01390, partial [Candidatus Marinimicrobia bacterium]|nr:hypothetical protein [Candidatus Neomarinimicrobiota bacterium]